jgi:hypothetical protein
MARGLAIALASAALAAVAAEVPGNKSSTVLKVGFAERDITPAIGMEAPGGYGKSYHRTFHDPCKVRAVVFDDGRRRVALVGVDLLFVTRHLVKEVRGAVEKRTRIAGENVLIGASHSHSSGPIGMEEPGDYDHAPEFVQKLARDHSTVSDPGYTLLLKRQIVEAVAAANDSRAEAKVAMGFGHEDKVAFNRRLRMKNGQSWSHPGAGNPDIVDYAGPIDPQVGVVGAWDAKGSLLGVVVNYACHATTSPGGISANWIWAMEQTLRGATGNAALPVVFLAGACGDVTQVDNLTKFQNPAPEEWCQIVGGRVGAEAFKTLLLIRRGASADIPLDVRQRVWNVRRRPPESAKVAKALELVRKTPKEVGPTEWTFAKETVLLDALMKSRPEVEVEVQAVQVGAAVFVATPAEYFVEYGLDIKKGSKFPFTFPVELANGICGYVPTEVAMGPGGGGYETRLTSYSNLEISAGRQMARAGIELANEMTPGPVPQPPRLTSPRAPWTYGNVAPETR